MIQVTLQFEDDLAAALYFASRLGNTGKVQVAQSIGATFTATEKAAVLGNAPPAPSAARTAPSPRTAEAAPSPSAPSPAAPAPAPTATPPAADASSANAPGEFKYETLQKAVNAAVPKYGKDALLAIAKKHGADNFKGLDASAWAAAHADVVALGV